MNPAKHIYSAIANESKDSVLGGIIHTREETFAKLLYLAPASQLGHPELPELVEDLSRAGGEWGAFHVIAKWMRRSARSSDYAGSGSRSTPGRGCVGCLSNNGSTSGVEWARVKSVDLHSVQNLYHQIVRRCCSPSSHSPKTIIWVGCVMKA
jgi:hypothetical protein